jgi:indolepyruvate ferredoxin oxidoreductase beta subunit
MMPQDKDAFSAMRIFFTGVGGQGTLVATRLVGEAALEEGLPVKISEIHGMAQRGGVVESSVVMGKAFSPTIADGEADILMAFEPMEALRALPKCHPESLVLSSNRPIIPFTVATGQDTYPELSKLDELIRSKVERLLWVDAEELALKAGSPRTANIVVVGALAGTRKIPISRNSWQEALKRIFPERLLDVNLRAFEAGFACGEKS